MKQQSKEKMYQISNEEILGNYIRTQDKKEMKLNLKVDESQK